MDDCQAGDANKKCNFVEHIYYASVRLPPNLKSVIDHLPVASCKVVVRERNDDRGQACVPVLLSPSFSIHSLNSILILQKNGIEKTDVDLT